jgi:hypothetical protein
VRRSVGRTVTMTGDAVEVGAIVMKGGGSELIVPGRMGLNTELADSACTRSAAPSGHGLRQNKPSRRQASRSGRRATRRAPHCSTQTMTSKHALSENNQALQRRRVDPGATPGGMADGLGINACPIKEGFLVSWSDDPDQHDHRAA